MKYLILIMLMMPYAVFGQTISSVEGTVSTGSTLTISGSGLGVKSPAAPLRYANFEDGVDGGVIANQANGGFYYNDTAVERTPLYSNDRQRVTGEMCLFQDFSQEIYTTSNQGIGFTTYQMPGIDLGEFYMSGWTYRDDFDGTAMECGNAKIWGNMQTSTGPRASGVGTYGQPQLRYDTYPWPNDNGLFGPTDCDELPTLGTGFAGTHTSSMYLDQWMRMERYVNEMEWGEVGTQSAWANLNLVFTDNKVMYTCGDPYDNWLIGQYFRRTETNNPSDAHIKIYWGEIYLDVTRMRVELGDASVFANCTHREIQIPTAWAADEITVTANVGSFADDATAWIFVVDADGVASAGSAVTISQTAVGLPGIPAAPTNLTVTSP